MSDTKTHWKITIVPGKLNKDGFRGSSAGRLDLAWPSFIHASQFSDILPPHKNSLMKSYKSPMHPEEMARMQTHHAKLTEAFNTCLTKPKTTAKQASLEKVLCKHNLHTIIKDTAAKDEPPGDISIEITSHALEEYTRIALHRSGWVTDSIINNDLLDTIKTEDLKNVARALFEQLWSQNLIMESSNPEIRVTAYDPETQKLTLRQAFNHSSDSCAFVLYRLPENEDAVFTIQDLSNPTETT